MDNAERLMHEDDKLLDDEGGELALRGNLACVLPLLADLDAVCSTGGHGVLCRGGEIGAEVIEAWREALEDRDLIAVELHRADCTRVVWRVLSCQIAAPSLNFEPGRHTAREDLLANCEVRELTKSEARWIEELQAFMRDAGSLTLN